LFKIVNPSLKIAEHANPFESGLDLQIRVGFASLGPDMIFAAGKISQSVPVLQTA